MNTNIDPAAELQPSGIAAPLRLRHPDDAPDTEPTGDLLYPDLALPYLRAARAAADEPTPARFHAAAEAAHHLATRYTSAHLLTQGSSPREYQAGTALFKQASQYRALAAPRDEQAESVG